MRLPWFFNPRKRSAGAGKSRRRKSSSLRVRSLERRRVLNASIQSIAVPAAAFEGSSVTATANATGQGQLSYSWSLTQGNTTLATGANPSFNFTPPDDGNFNVNLTVGDNSPNSDSKSVGLLVKNQPPVLTVALDQTVDEGQSLNLTGNANPLLGLFVDDGKLDTHTATVDWGDGSPLQSAAVLESQGSGAILGSHTYADDGTYKATVTVFDNANASAAASFNVKVNDVAPQLINVVGSTINENSFATITAKIDDPGIADTFSIDVDWQDNTGTAHITGLGASNSSGTVNDTTYQWTAATRQITLSHQFVDDGPSPGNNTASDTYHVALTVTDNFPKSTSTTADVVVNNLKPVLFVANDQAVNEGQLLDLSGQAAPILGVFIDIGTHDKHTATVDWGDGSGVQVPMLSEAAGSGVLTGTHTYVESGTYTVKVTVSDDDLGTSDVGTFTVTVNDVAPTALLANNGPINEGSSGLVTFSNQFDPSPIDTAAGFRYAYDLNNDGTFDVGDGTYAGSGTTASQSVPGTILVDGPGDYTVRARILDKDGKFTDYTTVIHVNNLPPVLTVALDQMVDEGQLLNLTGNANPLLGLFVDDGKIDTHTATVNWGDGSPTEAATVSEVPGTGSGVLTATHTYKDDGTYTVTVLLTDNNGGVSQPGIFHVKVNDVAPQLVNVVGSTINENGVATVTANVQDPGSADTFEVDVNWQDGSATDEITGLGAADSSGTVAGTSYQWTAATRQITLSHQYVDDGPSPGNNTASDTYHVALTVTDNFPKSSSTTADVIVNNLPPVLFVTGDKVVDEGQLLDLSGQMAPILGVFADNGTHDKHTATVDWGDGTGVQVPMLSEAAGSGVLTGTHTYADDGTYTVKVTVSDDDLGTSDVQTFKVTVNDVAPQLINVVGSTINENGIATVTANVQDPGVLDTFSLDVNWQDGSAPDQITGLGATDTSGTVAKTSYQWTAATRQIQLSHQYLDDGQSPGNNTASDLYKVALTITDNFPKSTSTTADVTVNNLPPVLTVTGDKTINEGQLLDLTGNGHPLLGLFVDTGTLDKHTATVDWGDGSGPYTPVINEVNGTGSLSGSHTYADDGTYIVKVTVSDDDLGTSDVQTFSVTVHNVNPSLTVTPTPPTTIAEGSSVSFGATFTDPGFDNPNNPNPVDPANNITDPTHESFTYDVSWGDGRDAITGMTASYVAGTAGTPSSGSFNGSHTYADDGTYTVTDTIHDDNGGSDVKMFTVTVNNVDPTLTLTPTPPTTINEGGSVGFTASFKDPGFDNPADPTTPSTGDRFNESFTYDVNWGDGRETISGMTVSDTNGGPGVDSTGNFSGSHIYADDGTYLVTVTIHDDNGGSDTKTFSVTVNNVNPTLAVTPTLATPVTINEGGTVGFNASFSDPGFDNPANPTTPATGDPFNESFTYDVNWGDGRDAITGMSVSDTNGGEGVDSTGTFSGTHTYADDGTYLVTVTIHDDNGGSDVKTFTVTVNNVNPTLSVTPTLTTPVSINEGDSVGFNASFSDPGFDNPNNPTTPATGDPLNESFTYDVNWGDGNNALTGVAVSDTNGSPGVDSTGSFSGSHTYADDGTYTVTVTIHDDNGGIDTKTFTVTVHNVDPVLTGTTSLTVNEGDAFTLTGLGVGFKDPGFDNPNNPNPADPANNITDPTHESFAIQSIDWGDGSVDSSTVAIGTVVQGSPGVMTTGQFTHAPHTYADDGVYTVKISYKDDNGAFVSESLQITVKNVAPTLTLSVGDQTILESGDVVLPVIAHFSDPGFDNPNNPNPADPANNIADPTHESFTYDINWGDGRDTVAAMSVADLNGSPGTPSTGNFGGSHNYADNGTYTVHVAVHDDNGGVSQILTFHVIVNNVAPSFVQTPSGQNFDGDNVSIQGITKVRVGYTDPGYDNPLNTLDATNGGQVAETPVYVVDWGDGTIDAMHKYAVDGNYTVTVTITPNGGSAQTFTFNGFNSSTNPVLTLVNGQTLNGAQTLYTYVVNWGDNASTTLQLSLASPGNPVINTGDPLVDKGITKVVSTNRASGSASLLTTGSSEIQHQYLGPPDPMHPTQDIKITMTVADDDDAQITDSIFVKNPGIQTQIIVIDTTPGGGRLEFATPPSLGVFVGEQTPPPELVQNIDIRGAGGQMAATSDRYLELRVVYPDDTEGQGYRIKDEALNDLRGFFKTLPDGKYRIYLVRTENNSHRLVIEVNVRRGHVIDMSDESEGTRDRPPTSEDKGQPAKPLNENPQLEPVPGGVGSNMPNVPEAVVTTSASPQTETRSVEDTNTETREPNSEPTQPARRAAALTGLGLVAAARPWSEEVDEALAEADERAWQRLRRAGRRGRFQHQPVPSGNLKG